MVSAALVCSWGDERFGGTPLLGLLPLAGLALEQREAAHTVLRALPAICHLTWELGVVHSETAMEQMPKCGLCQRFIWEWKTGNHSNITTIMSFQKSLTGNRGLSCTFLHWFWTENYLDCVDMPVVEMGDEVFICQS